MFIFFTKCFNSSTTMDLLPVLFTHSEMLTGTYAEATYLQEYVCQRSCSHGAHFLYFAKLIYQLYILFHEIILNDTLFSILYIVNYYLKISLYNICIMLHQQINHSIFNKFLIFRQFGCSQVFTVTIVLQRQICNHFKVHYFLG